MNQDISIDLLAQKLSQALETVGQQPYIDWQKLKLHENTLASQLDKLIQKLIIFKSFHQKDYLLLSKHSLTVKTLKSLDAPDILKSFNQKKLQKDSLKYVVSLFKLENEKLSLKDPNIKEEALNIASKFEKQTEELTEHFQNMTQVVQKYTERSEAYNQKAKITQEQKKNKFVFNEQKVQQLCKQIVINYVPQTDKLISFKTYKQILQMSVELAKDVHNKLLDQAREEQRKLLAEKQYSKYLNTSISYINKDQQLLYDAQSIICQKLGIDSKNMEQSEILLINRGLSGSLYEINTNIRQNLKQSKVTKKPVDKNKAKEVIKYHIFLMNDTAYFKDIFDRLEKNQENLVLIPALLTNILNDLIFQKFKIQEEDYSAFVNQNYLQNNFEFMLLFKQIQTAVFNLMFNLGFYDPRMMNPNLMNPQLGMSNNPMKNLQQAQNMYNMLYPQMAMFQQMGMMNPQMAMNPQMGMMNPQMAMNPQMGMMNPQMAMNPQMGMMNPQMAMNQMMTGGMGMNPQMGLNPNNIQMDPQQFQKKNEQPPLIMPGMGALSGMIPGMGISNMMPPPLNPKKQ